uniref:Zinc finger protein MAGPIE n=1 Tax=Cajanus cajan TaxID=3821 RepID=A0A151R5P5_CAJCA|nr:Zinc finger protein MAGPIE [Cajanus cajan]
MDNASTASGDASVSSSGNQTKAATKKKRNLPGMPDPEAEVIALSPKTLLATNRFVCEICNKGFQRDQNLQLHRRGHNLPWKLRQRSSKEVRKRVYVCPERTCVHHDPSRALGDLTGIKKHFCRKHGEKKWKCDKCSKKYAVHSDWKAHSKVCGTREYKCDCGTVFSRRDSFITHRAFCDALAEESSRSHTVVKPDSENESKVLNGDSPPTEATVVASASTAQSNSVVSSGLQTQNLELPENNNPIEEPEAVTTTLSGSCGNSTCSTSNGGATSNKSSVFARRADHPAAEISAPSSSEAISLCLSTTNASPIFTPPPMPPPVMSATALLQKAAQMGATATNASLLRSFGIMSSSSASASSDGLQWGQQQVEPESSSGLKELMMGTAPSMFGPKHTTLDFLGLGMAAGGTSGGGLSALITSIGGGLDVTAAFGNGEFSGKDIGRSS